MVTYDDVPLDDGQEPERQDHRRQESAHPERDPVLFPDVRKLGEDGTVDGFFHGRRPLLETRYRISPRGMWQSRWIERDSPCRSRSSGKSTRDRHGKKFRGRKACSATVGRVEPSVKSTGCLRRRSLYARSREVALRHIP